MHGLRTQNVLPDGFNGEAALALGLCLAGVAAVIVLERLSNRAE
jgi:putative membrane protein